jgi:hypothetical protein
MTGATLVISSGYLTQPSRSRGRHRKQPPPRRLLLRRRLTFGGSAVLLAVLVVSVGAMVKWATAAPDPFAVDDRGFVNSGVRCDGTQTAVAIGRTPGSLVVICADRNGRYGYLGLRLSDEAVLKTSARSTSTHGFIAQNASVTYSISPAELRVTVGGVVIKQEPMIDYEGPRP